MLLICPACAFPIAAAGSSPLAAIVLKARSARLFVWVFNLEGTIDLLAAIVLGTIYGAEPYMGPAYWIPAFWVPALLVTHYITFVLLRQPRGFGK